MNDNRTPCAPVPPTADQKTQRDAQDSDNCRGWAVLIAFIAVEIFLDGHGSAGSVIFAGSLLRFAEKLLPSSHSRRWNAAIVLAFIAVAIFCHCRPADHRETG
jgi:hypothetical protein